MALFVVICHAAPVRDVVEEGPDLLELGFGHSQITQAAKHLGAVSKVSPVGHLDYVAPIRDTDTPIRIRRHGDTASSKNKDTPIRRVYIEAEK